MGTRRRPQFRPLLDSVELESRVVLSRASVGFNVLAPGLNQPYPSLRRGVPSAPVALVNRAFDQFKQEYTQARSVYFDAVKSSGASESDEKAFEAYTQERVNLLAQQLTNSLLPTTTASSKKNKDDSVPSVLVAIRRQINQRELDNNGNFSTTNYFNAQTLGRSLVDAIPAKDSKSEVSVGLAALAQDNAIEAARVGIINAVNMAKSGQFGNSRRN